MNFFDKRASQPQPAAGNNKEGTEKPKSILDHLNLLSNKT